MLFLFEHKIAYNLTSLVFFSLNNLVFHSLRFRPHVLSHSFSRSFVNTEPLTKHECCVFTFSTSLYFITASKCNLQVKFTLAKVNFFITFVTLFYYYFITFSTKKYTFCNFPENAVGGLHGVLKQVQ